MKKILIYILCMGAFVSCKKETQLPDVEKYKYDIPAVKLTQDVRVGAYYSNYATADWNKKQSDVSLIGKTYNAVTDASVFPKQLSWADEAGVDYLIFKWNASSTDNALLNAFVKGRTTQNVRMVIDYNTAHLNASNTTPLDGAILKKMVDEMKLLIDQHISKEYYYKIDNRPVILLTPINLSSSRLTSIDYKMVTETLREEMKKVGVDPFFIGELTTGWTAPVNFDSEVLASMDAIVLTTWNTADFDRWWAFYSFSDLNWLNWKNSLEKLNVEFAPCIFPGYDEPSAATQRAIERTEKNYVDYTNVAKRSMGKNSLVIINSWNDFSRGTALEPSVNFDKQFLEITKREFKVN